MGAEGEATNEIIEWEKHDFYVPERGILYHCARRKHRVHILAFPH